jgi:hypothetical protein
VEKTDEATVTVLSHSFRLIPKLSLLGFTELDTAQREADLSKIVAAAAKLIHKADRDRFLEVVLSEPDDEADVIDLDTFLDALEKAVERVIGRPTLTSGS